MKTKRRREPIYLVMAAVFAWVSFVLWVDSDFLKAVTVACLGVLAFSLAVHGKSERPGVGLSERLLHLLPEPLWRAAIGLMGLGITSFGAWGISEAIG